MKRDPRTDPMAGDIIRHEAFGGGATFEVLSVNGPDASRQNWMREGYVSVRISMDDGHKLRMPVRRLGMKDWAHFFSDAMQKRPLSGRDEGVMP